MEWITRYRELAPTKQVIKEQLEKSGAYIEDLKVWSFDEGRDANRTSAIVINMSALNVDVKNDLIGSIMYQMNEGTFWDGSNEDKPPATPNLFREIKKDTNEIQSDLPF